VNSIFETGGVTKSKKVSEQGSITSKEKVIVEVGPEMMVAESEN
jgi:hypothetical protein